MPRQVKGCPVCGRRYQGSLVDHLDRKLPGSGGITRCDWNLNEARINYAAYLMRAGGWCRAGTSAAPTARLIRGAGLAGMTASGDISTKVHVDFLNPDRDLKCWWIRAWAYPIALVSRWPVRQRAQIIVELRRDDLAQEVIDAAFRVGGPDAVAQLEGQVIPSRCGDMWTDPAKHRVMPRGGLAKRDRCVLAQDHEGVHVGCRSGQVWWPGGYTSEWVTYEEPVTIDVEAPW